MAAGSSANYGTLCVQVMDGNNTIRDAYDMQTADEKIGLEAKLNVILSLLDPSSSEDFTTALAEKQNGTELSIDKAIQELRADKIIKYFKENGGKDPVAQIMTDWFDTFELAVDDAELLPGFEKQICRVAKAIINRAYIENKEANEGKNPMDQAFCRYSRDDGFLVMVDGQEQYRTIMQLCGEGFKDRAIKNSQVSQRFLGIFEYKRPYKSYRRDFTAIAECLIDNDPNVVNSCDDALVSALRYRNDNLASMLIQRRTQKSRVRLIFEQQGRHSQKISFQDVIRDPSMKKTVVAVLDCLISKEIGLDMTSDRDEDESQTLTITDNPVRYHFFYQILDGDEKGRPPLQRKVCDASSPAKALVKRREFTRNDEFDACSKSCLQILCQSKHKSAINHPVVRTLARRKWEIYGERRIWMYTLAFAFYLMLLVVALLLAVAVEDPRRYPTSVDRFRGFCEVLTILGTLVYLFLDFDQMWKEEPRWYFRDFSNLVDFFGILSLLSLIPLRYTNVRSQWIVASLSCILNFMRISKYFPASKLVGVYAKTLAILVKKDLKIFAIFYTFVLLMFCSSIYLALRAFSKSSGFHHVDVSGFGDIMFRELRSLAQSEGFSSAYTNYSVFSIILIMVSMFVTMVFMVNLLIAQLTSTYEKAYENAEINHDISKALFTSQLDNSRFPWLNPRLTHYTPGSYEHDKEKVKELFEKWESVKDAKSC